MVYLYLRLDFMKDIKKRIGYSELKRKDMWRGEWRYEVKKIEEFW